MNSNDRLQPIVWRGQLGSKNPLSSSPLNNVPPVIHLMQHVNRKPAKGAVRRSEYSAGFGSNHRIHKREQKLFERELVLGIQKVMKGSEMIDRVAGEGGMRLLSEA